MQEGDEIVVRLKIGKSPTPPWVRVRRLLKIAGRQLQLEDLGAQPGDYPAGKPEGMSPAQPTEKI